MKILMVCLGNICRSPLAEGILQNKAKAAGLHWQVDSAGTNSYHTGDAPHHLSQKIALHNGINISHQRSRKLVPQDFERYDAIYAMAKDVVADMQQITKNSYDANKVALLMNELHPGKNEDVPDPYYGGEQGYHEVYAMMEKACEAIVQKALTPKK